MDLDDNDPVKMYVREVASVQPLTKEEETDLFQELRKSGELREVAERRLLESNLHLVLPIAERHASRGLSMLDLIQDGNLGLIRAVQHFPETPFDDFSTYAGACIEEAISEALGRSKSKQ